MSARLDHLAARVATDPLFLASQLHRYATARGFTDAALAAELGVDADGLTRLRLCGVLATEADVRRVVEGIGCDAVALTRMALE